MTPPLKDGDGANGTSNALVQFPTEPPPSSTVTKSSITRKLKKKTSSMAMATPDESKNADGKSKGGDEIEQVCVDGNWAVSHASYRMNDVAYIFPITPSSAMGETVDEWAAQTGPKQKKNLWDQPLKVVEMQSEGGAAGALHGALVSGSLATTFTASQGLLLYIPNLYKIAGELLPTVIHVASRALAGQALSIYGDHSDTMLLRGCGVAIVSSFSVQEAHDMAIVCQTATLRSRVPFVHFFDGFRTSHEINKIRLVSDGQLRELMPWDEVEAHRQRGLSPMHPSQRGTAQNPDVFMQLVESSNSYYNAVPGVVAAEMERFGALVGRTYRPYEYYYYGTTRPTVAIIAMGSGVKVVQGTLRYLQSEAACLLGVRMFRPWNEKMFLEALPKTVQRVAVLDRTREGGSQGEPLYLDVCTSLMQGGRGSTFVTGGRYGLGSKDFTPRMVQAVLTNLNKKHTRDIQRPFTVGIDDDVTHLSLPLGKPLHTLSCGNNTKNRSSSSSNDNNGNNNSKRDQSAEITQCVFFGFGSDGTVGGNKQAIKIIGDYSPKTKVQAYFEYDAKKSSGWSVSHLRFSTSKSSSTSSEELDIDAPYRIGESQANYVACHNESYVQAHKFDVAKYLARGGTFFLNTTIASLESAEQRLDALATLVSPKILRKLALRNINFYIMDAGRLATAFGLTGRINMICMCVFFRLAGVLPLDDAMSLLRASIIKTYGYKGEAVVETNLRLLDAVVKNERNLIQVDIPASWKTLNLANHKSFLSRHIELIDDAKTKKFMTDIVDPISKLEGDGIPVSKFLQNNLLGGVMIPGTSRYEKRNPNPSQRIPEWQLESCTQCNLCVFVCPHAAIRPFVLTKEEAAKAPFLNSFKTVKAQGAELHGKRYALQVSTLDCTGCNACVEVCPEQPKALKMTDLEDVLKAGGDQNWDYAVNKLPNHGATLMDSDAQRRTLRGSQFQTPLMEFSGACSGCGETPYFKLLTQLFGERMVIANATGCSTIWGGSFPSNPYTVNAATGRGPAWANSLFEDNAEFGLGMFSSMAHRRDRLVQLVQDYVHSKQLDFVKASLGEDTSSNGSRSGDEDAGGDGGETKIDSTNQAEEEHELVSLLQDWLDARHEKSEKCTRLFDRMKPLFESLLPQSLPVSASGTKKATLLLRSIWSDRDMFPKISQWIVGGDGWAYDIGYGGLDHIEAFEANDVNVLVVDTEMYSNTGGQQSKATPKGASVKFAMGGKVQQKKNIGEIFMTYEHVYVASVALAYPAQVLQAFVEADQHDGPSIIIAYAPCIQHAVTPNGLNDMIDESKYAVESGYWPLYRFNPELAKQDKNPFVLDSKKLRHTVSQFLRRERRFMNLQKNNPEIADELFAQMNQDVLHRMEHLKEHASGYKAFDHPDDASCKVLFASETGNAAHMARDFAAACTLSHEAEAMDDLDSLDDVEGKHIVFFIATCGQGAMPQNGRQFYQDLCDREEPFKEGTTFTIMGLGDSSYYFFCKAAKDVEARMLELGAKKMLDMGLGDDAADGGKDAGLHDWLEGLWPALGVKPPEEVPHIVTIKLSFSKQALLKPEQDLRAVHQYFGSDDVRAVSAPILKNERMCPPDYDRDFRCIHIARNSSSSLRTYTEGDCLEIFPQNDAERVTEFLHEYSADYDERTVVKIHAWGIDGDISLGCLMTNVLDLFGPPTLHFMQQLATFETKEEARRAEMLDLNRLKQEQKRAAVTIADMLLKYKNTAHPPLPALLAMIPRLKPRAYSIASAPASKVNKNCIELCVLIDTFWCDEGMRYGLTCDMLRRKSVGSHLWCRLKTGSMDPPTAEQPVLCAGIGSGLAPHLSFLRARVAIAEAGEDVGPFSLFFGNRNRSDEFLYHSELEDYSSKYDWFSLHTAFSRDQAKKVYVQDLVAQTDDARRLLMNPTLEGMLYICGNRHLPKPMQQSLVASFTSSKSDDPEAVAKAKDIMEDMFIHGRAQQEVW